MLFGGLFAQSVRAVISNPTPTCVGTTCTITFDSTGDYYLWTPPTGARNISFDLMGAQGGRTGGLGGRVQGSFVTPPASLYIYVGGAGLSGAGAAGGFNGGGAAGGSRGDEGSGGGATDIRSTTSLNDRIAVAAGGGGTGGFFGGAGGAGGGLTGNAGTSGQGQGGSAGSPSAGGNGGSPNGGTWGTSGGLGIGGTGGTSSTSGGGGGGGGYYGGGSGGVSQDSAPQADGVGGGGGGSSWAGGTGVTGGAFTSGTTTGNGSITIDPPSAIPTAAFAFTGAPQFYTVPANTSALFVRLYGAGAGAQGDIVYGRVPVTAGQVLQLNIGGRGYGDATDFPGHSNGEGGWNGGGLGYVGPGWGGGGGGGGATDVRSCTTPQTTACALSDRLLVAAGGGGASYGAWGLGGGRGGAAADGSGGNGSGNGDQGFGASLTAGGAIGGTGIAAVGALGIGGQSGQPFYGGGGGGGGLYGGGGGNGSGGGGGSSCASVSGACTSLTNVLGTSNAPFGHSQGNGGSTSDGMAVITAMPEATTGAVSSVTGTTANVAATINAKYLASTPKLFIGTNQSTIDSCSAVNAPCTASSTVLRTASLATVLAGTTTQAVSGAITGLTANTTYYYRVCAQSVAGYSCGATSTFTTALGVWNGTLASTGNCVNVRKPLTLPLSSTGEK